MPNDAINVSLIGGKLETLDRLCRAKRLAAGIVCVLVRGLGNSRSDKFRQHRCLNARMVAVPLGRKLLEVL